MFIIKTEKVSKFLIAIIFLCTSLSVFSQTKKTSSVDYFGIGYSNLGGFGISKLLSDSAYSPQFYIEYHEGLDTNTFARFGISTGFKTERLGTVRYYNLIPFNLYVGLEKRIGNDKIKFIYGADIFFGMSLRGSQLGAGTWRGDDFGTGLSALIGLDFVMNQNWSIGTELSSGLGIFRTYQNIGTTTAATISPKFFFLKSISLGLKYRILPKKVTTTSE